MSRLTWRRWILVVVGLCAGVVVVLALVDLLRIRSDLLAGQHDLSALDLDTAAQPGGVAAVANHAADTLHAADVRAHDSTWLGILDHVPLVHDQIAGLRGMTQAGDEVGAAARSAGTTLGAALDEASGSPAGRIALLDTAADQVAAVGRTLDAIDLGPHDRLLPPLSGARADLARHITKAEAKLTEASGYIGALHRLLQGPTKLLVFGANNAEMTSGSGMPLSGGVATVAGGDIDLGPFTSAAILLKGNSVNPGANLVDLYAPMGLGYDFRGTTVTPNFPTTGAIAAEMAARSQFGPVDGVAAVDAVCLRAILQVVGPVTVNGTEYNADNVLEQVLNTNYLLYNGDSNAQSQVRVELQGQIAKAAFDAIRTRKAPLAQLIKAMRGAADGRHLLLYSSDPELEHLWDTIGASGHIPDDGMLLAPENYDGDKLDWYLRPAIDVTAARQADKRIRVDATLTITNPTRTVSNPYIDGKTPNEHFIWFDMHLPSGATDVTSYDHPFQSQGSDPPSQVAIMVDFIPTGETRTWHFSFVLPADQKAITLLPSARVAPIAYTVNGVAFGDAIDVTIPLAGLSAPPGPPSAALASGLVLMLLGFAFALNASRTPAATAAAAAAPRHRFDEHAATALLLMSALAFATAIL